MLRCSRYGSTAVEAGGGLGVPERSVLQRALKIEPEASLPQIFRRIVVIELDHVELAGQMVNKRGGQTAADIINGYDEQRLADIFFLYGELKNARKIASALGKARIAKRIETTNDLMKATEKLFRQEREKKEMAKMFQALRIEVNHEMDALKDMLKGATELLAPGGRLSVITYHSLEDRMVKNIMKTGNVEGKMEKDFFGRTETPFKLINSKVIIPTEEEQERNPRSRSAKLRIAEKI